MLFDPELAAKRKPSPVASASGAAPAGKGDPGTGVRKPSLERTENTEMLLEPRLATNTKLHGASVSTVAGWLPAAKGEPAAGVSWPVLVMLYPRTAELVTA